MMNIAMSDCIIELTKLPINRFIDFESRNKFGYNAYFQRTCLKIGRNF